ncbi:MAG: phosphate ABC transporter substrate-binding protein PstS [Armatimonadetes bacterium]|nr:phosphate ABC transporter substrate-binding protein PstS [Armatimonadota bacterium]
MRRWFGLGILLAAVAAAGCAGGPGGEGAPPSGPRPAPSAGALRLNGAGATFPYPLYSRWFDTYSREHGIQVNYQSIGSGGGIQQLKNRTVDFGASDAPLSDEEQKEMPAPVIHIPTVAGAVVLAYNVPDAPKGLRMSPEVVAGIFLGQIKKWNDPQITALNPDVSLPDTAVVVAHRSDGSGTTYIFTHYLSAVSPDWQTKVGAGKSVSWPVGLGGKGNEGVTGVVKQTPGGIGYVELAYAIQNNLNYAQVRNAAGQFVEPSVVSTTAAAAGSAAALKRDVRASIANAAGAEAYPISGFTYILVYRDQPDLERGKALADLLDWAIRDGQKFAPDLHYAPLPAAVVKINEAALRQLNYQGQPLLATAP